MKCVHSKRGLDPIEKEGERRGNHRRGAFNNNKSKAAVRYRKGQRLGTKCDINGLLMPVCNGTVGIISEENNCCIQPRLYWVTNVTVAEVELL